MLILQIITLAVSCLTLLINAYLSLSSRKKEQYIQVATEQFIKIFMSTRESVSRLLSLCCAESIDYAKKQNALNFYSDLTVEYCRLEIAFKKIYTEENELKIMLDSLRFNAFEYYNNSNETNRTKLNESWSACINAFSIYDEADWRFIRTQSSGKEVDFVPIYLKTKQEFEKTGL